VVSEFPLSGDYWAYCGIGKHGKT